MKAAVCAALGIVLAGGIAIAQAAPNIPPSEMPGRERQRFETSPIDRYTIDPRQRNEPLLRWQCHQRSTSRTVTRNKAC